VLRSINEEMDERLFWMGGRMSETSSNGHNKHALQTALREARQAITLTALPPPQPSAVAAAAARDYASQQLDHERRMGRLLGLQAVAKGAAAKFKYLDPALCPTDPGTPPPAARPRDNKQAISASEKARKKRESLLAVDLRHRPQVFGRKHGEDVDMW
jgi:hypothetical protein